MFEFLGFPNKYTTNLAIYLFGCNITLSGLQRMNIVEHLRDIDYMSWWPFKKKKKSFENEPHIKGSRMWLQELRELCEYSYNDRKSGQNKILQMRDEWVVSFESGEIEDVLFDGLNRRAKRLLNAEGAEWIACLDNEEFWKVGWRKEVEDE